MNFPDRLPRLVAGVLLALCHAFAIAPASAATYTVTTLNDSGPGSLRQAMLSAGISAAADEIVFTVNGVITLTSPLPNVVEAGGDLTITGNGAVNTIIDGGGAHSIFRLPNALNPNSGIDLTVRRLTLRNGYADQEQGGAIYINRASSLTIDEVEFVDNFSTYDGGAINASNIAGTVSISNSLFSGNRSTTTGAAIYAGGVTLSLRNSTLVSNIAQDSILQLAAASSRLVNLTLIENQAIYTIITREAPGTTSLSNTLLANNTTTADLFAMTGGQYTPATSRNNLIHRAGASGIANGTNGNQVGVIPPVIGSLGNYGGPTRTLPLLPGSPALNAGTNVGGDIPNADQRGIARVGAPDIGAFESRGFVMSAVSGGGQSAPASSAFTNPLIVQVTANQAIEPTQGGHVTFTAPASGASATLATPLALINGSGQAQTTVTANGTAGGPYTVTASAVNGSPTPPSVDFSLSNTPAGNPVCAAFTFPYTLADTDNTARVAELRQAIDCANGNATADEIDLDGHTLVFDNAVDGSNALPTITSDITLRNGELERQSAAPAFRFLEVSATGQLTVRDMQLRRGFATGEGGAILALGGLMLFNSTLENNEATTNGGAVSTHSQAMMVMTHFAGNTAVNGAALAGRSMLMLVNLTVTGHDSASAGSVIWADGYLAGVGLLMADNTLSATGSTLLFAGENAPVAEFRHVTIATNTVQGELLEREGSSTSNFQVRNSIVWGNQFASLGRITPMSSLLQGVQGMSDDPQFQDAAQRNYRLTAGSPAIDTGDNANSFLDSYDIDNDGDQSELLPDLDLGQRPINATVDMGVYEHQGTPCYDHTFPYTLTGTDNTARVAELRQAIECANANATADVIDLAGFTLVIDDADANDADNALPVITSAITLRNGTLERDTTAPDFRLLATSSGAHLIADSVNFRNGRAWEGGAIYNQGVLELQNAGFFDNGDLAQTQRGGAILNLGFTFRVLGSRFEGNRAELGGAIFQDTGDFFLRTSHLENNQATQGGALYALTGLARLLGNDFVENRANAGGAIHVETFVLASGQRFLRNQATTHGGAVSGNDFVGHLWLSNSLFVGNLAPQGAALHADNVRMSNVTLSGHAGGAGSSLFSTPTPGINAEVFNSIIWGNADTPVGVVTINRSLVEGGFPGGTDILDVDPRFTDAANGDYRLMAHSPAIDAGSNDEVVSDTWMDIDEDGDFSEELDDLDANPRRYNDTGVVDTGAGSAPVVDMGAYEKQTNSPVALPTLSINDVTLNEGNSGTTNFTFTVSLSAPAPTGGVTFDIATANGTAVAPGDYSAQSLSGQSIPAGSSTYNFTVQVNGDTMVERDETFFVNVSNVIGATVADSQGQGTIRNDDSAALTMSDVMVSESGPFTFTVTLNASTSASFSVDWFLLSEGTTQAADYVGGTLPTGGTLNFTGTAGETRTFTVPVLDDDLPEPTEAFTVGFRLFLTTGGFSVDINDIALGTIIDNDVADFTVTTTPTGITVTDANANGSTLVVTEPATNTVHFAAPGRTFSVNGGALVTNSGDLALTGITSITLNAPGGSAVASGAAFNIGGATLASASPVTLAGGTLRTTGSSAVVNAPIVLTADSDIVGTMSLARPISGDFTLRTFGTGTYRFNATGSTFARLNIASGTVALGGNNTLPAQIDIFNSSVFNLNGFSQSIDTYIGTGATQNTGPSTANLTLGVAGSASSLGTANYNGPISGAINLTCAVGCNQQLGSDISTYTGTTDVLGTLVVYGTRALGADGPGNGTTIAATGVLELRDVAYATNELLAINGGTLRSGTGSSSFTGPIALGTAAATLHTDAISSALALDGVISGTQGFIKTGVGSVHLGAVNTYLGQSVINDGRVVVTGSTAASSAISVNVGGTLAGTGTIGGPINVASGGTLAPGVTIGTLHTANVNLQSGAVFAVTIDGTVADSGYDQLDVNGTVALGDATLSLSGSHVPAVGQSFMLIDNDGADAVSGTFDGLPNGAALTFNGANLVIRYDGGDGNDVVLTRALPVANVLSLDRASGNPNNAPNTTWTLTFDTPISGLTAANFALLPVGLGGTPVISGTGTSGPDQPDAVWIITASTGTGSGTLGLNLINAGGLSHSIGNLPFTGQVFDIDRTPPTLAITVTDDELFSGDTSSVSFVFSETVTGLSAASINVANGELSALTTSDSITWTTTLTPTPGIVAPANVITVDMSGISDIPGNPGVGSALSNNYAIDTRARNLSIDDVTQSEGDSGTVNFTFTVSLNLPAVVPVSFDIATADGTATVANNDYVAQSLVGQSIPVGSSSYSFTVLVNGDLVTEADETFVVNLSNVVGATVTDAQGIGTILNDDSAGFTINPTSGLVTTEAGGTATFTVVLNSQPTADVSIGLSSSDTTEGTVAPTSLTFTTANWNAAQTVTVTGVDDAVVDGDIAYTIVTAAAVSTDANYNGINPADVAVTNTDDDVAGITVNPTSGLITTEAGGTATFSVVLNSQPTADVSIALSSSDTTEGTVAPTSLTFTAANWNAAQTVTITGVDDTVVDGDIAYTIVTAAAVSTDANYSGINPADVAVTNTDDDVAGITVNPTSGLVTTEAGGTATFTVVLNSQPTADVSIGLSSSDTTEGTVDPTSLTFTAANWNAAQTVTVTGVDDAVVDGDIAYTIVTAAAVSTDANYNGINPADVAVTNTDDDVAGVIVSPTSGLVTTESAGTATFTVVLNSQPTGDVTIPLTSSDTSEGTVAPATLLFTPANWNVAQTVTITGVDDGIVDGDQLYTIQLGPSLSADAVYDGFAIASVSVTNRGTGDIVPPVVIPVGGPLGWLALMTAMLLLAGGALSRRSVRQALDR